MADLSALAALLSRGDWPAAERLLRRAAQARTPSAAVFYNLAKVLEAQGKTSQRTAWLKRALKADPRHAKAWFELGRDALERQALPEAERAFARAATLAPEDEDAWRMALRLRLRLAQWDAASEALRHLPDDVETRCAAYRIACETGRVTDAQRNALLARPEDRPDALKALVRVARGTLPLRIS